MIETTISPESSDVTTTNVLNSDVQSIERDVAEITIALQQWLTKYISTKPNIPAEGVAVELPEFGIESAVVVKSESGLHALVNNAGSRRVVAAV